MSRALKTYQFCYSIDGIFTELPTYITVKARDLRAATKAARRELKRKTDHYSAAYWEYEGPMGGPYKPVYHPYRRTGGHLYLPGHEVKPIKPRTPEQRVKDREVWDKLVVPMMAKLGPDPFGPIRKAIEDAPVIAELFSKTTFDYGAVPSIPLVFTSPMPRHLWPHSRDSKRIDNPHSWI